MDSIIVVVAGGVSEVIPVPSPYSHKQPNPMHNARSKVARWTRWTSPGNGVAIIVAFAGDLVL